MRNLLRITNKKSSVATVLWDTFFNTMPLKLRDYMKHHDKDLHVIVQGIEGQVMLDVIDEVGRWPLPFHDAILVPEDFGEFAINALKSAYRKHTKGGQVVVTKQTQK